MTCNCRSEYFCGIAILYAEYIRDCFEGTNSDPTLLPDWYEIVKSKLNAFSSDVITYQFDLEKNKGESFFAPYRVNDSKLAWAINSLTHEIYTLTKLEYLDFVECLYRHDIKWNI